MHQTVRYLLALAVFTTVVINVVTRAASLPDGGEFELYNPQDSEPGDAGAGSYLADLQKRMGCRPGYTYQAIIRDCVPSLGALRGRGRGRGRGRYRS